MNILQKIKQGFWVISLLTCYALYAAGQVWLFIMKQQYPEFYDLLTKNSAGWINAHLLLMLGLVLTIPAYLAIKDFLKTSKQRFWIDISFFFLCIWAFLFFGQFTIDLCFVEVFSLKQEASYQVLDKIQGNPVIRALFYDNSKLFPLFKYLDPWTLSQLSLGVGLISSRVYPRWAIVLFFAALILCTFGILLHPYYGRIIKRSSYSLLNISFLPVVVSLIKRGCRESNGPLQTSRP